MNINNPKLVIGFILYNDFTAKYLPYFFESLNKQSFKDYKIIIQDNSDNKNNNNKKYLDKNYSKLEIIYSGGNIGYSRANNNIINKVIETGAKYVLFLNPDMIFDESLVDTLIKTIENNEKLGSLAPKIKKWNFVNNNKTNIIDTCGIKEVSALRFADIGQGQVDENQFDSEKMIGPSGAAAMYRVSALEKVKDEYGYFDERMFMYKEDCDLAYRLRLAGYKTRLVQNAIVYHDRTASAIGEGDIYTAVNRRNKSKQVRKWSFLNQHIIFKKHWHTLNLKRKVEVVWFALKMFVFALLFERYLLMQYKKLRHWS